uniref:Uncharacterized protein n=2 Tax=Anguilla anguilla TaxID=7936 RepID=A0A0E9QM22_ANGAN
MSCRCLSLSLGGTRGVQGQYQQGEWVSEEDTACKCALAAVWLFMLLLHPGIQPVACYLPQQASKDTPVLLSLHYTTLH